MEGSVLQSGKQYPSFPISKGVKQECVLAPALFSLFLAATLHIATSDVSLGISICFRFDDQLQYDDDCMINSEEDLQVMLD